MRSDRELFDGWAAGDSACGNELVGRHYDRIARFFHNKAPAEATDLVQETFKRLLEAHDRFAGKSALKTYLFRIAYNVLCSYIGRKQRGGAEPDLSVRSLADLCPSPSSVARHSEEHERLNAALRNLPVELQVVLELYYWEDMSGPQLAATLGIAEPAVRSRLRRAKAQLERQLGTMPAGLTSAGLGS